MALSAGGSTGAASLTTLDATTSEGDTHLSPMMMRGDEPRFDDDARRASPERSTRAARGRRGERDAGRDDGTRGETTTGTTTRTTTRTSNGARETRMKTVEMRYECPRSTRRR